MVSSLERNHPFIDMLFLTNQIKVSLKTNSMVFKVKSTQHAIGVVFVHI